MWSYTEREAEEMDDARPADWPAWSVWAYAIGLVVFSGLMISWLVVGILRALAD